MTNRQMSAGWMFLLLGSFVGCQPEGIVQDNKLLQNEISGQSEQPSLKSGPPLRNSTIELFDGQSLAGWEVTNFGGEGDCRLENGSLIVEAGYPLSGVTSTRADLPKSNYEISLEAKKNSGVDFFCGLTFPVADSHCTFVVGGWAGAVVGLSCIDDQDAAHNATRKLMKFEKGQWYKIRVRVEPNRIRAWIDEQSMVDQDIEGKKISVRNETRPSRPLGLCNFETTSEFRNIRLTTLPVEK